MSDIDKSNDNPPDDSSAEDSGAVKDDLEEEPNEEAVQHDGAASGILDDDASDKVAEDSVDEDESTVDDDEDDERTVKSDDASTNALGLTNEKSTPKSKGSKQVSGVGPSSSAKRGRSPSVKGLTIPFRTVKKAMKVDPDTPIVQNEAAVMTTIAAELFLKRLANESFRNAKRRGRNTIRYEDIAEARANNPSLLFLETLLP